MLPQLTQAIAMTEVEEYHLTQTLPCQSQDAASVRWVVASFDW